VNIFVLSTDVKECAEFHCDKHCVKMILETAQLLCSVFWMQGIEAPYKLSHKNHPRAIWARTSKENFEWLLSLGYALVNEYARRYLKKHKTKKILDWIDENKYNLNWDEVGLTPFALAMPDECKCADPVESYRKYYKTKKTHLLTWKTQIPYWITEPLQP